MDTRSIPNKIHSIRKLALLSLVKYHARAVDIKRAFYTVRELSTLHDRSWRLGTIAMLISAYEPTLYWKLSCYFKIC